MLRASSDIASEMRKVAAAAARRPIRLVILTPYPEGRAPSARYRYEQFLPALRAEGFDCTVLPFFTPEGYDAAQRGGSGMATAIAAGMVRRRRERKIIRKAEVVLVHREAVPVATTMVEGWAAAAGVPLVYDLDDALWLPGAHPSGRRWRMRTGGKVEALMARADLVLAGNEHIAQHARDHARTVVTMPTVIDTDHRFNVMHIHREGAATIAWTGSRRTIHELEELAPVLRRISEDRPFTKFTVISDVHPDLGLPNVRNVTWSPETEVRPLIGADIGVVPMDESRENLGKCGLKLIQYMALGIVPVASMVGSCFEIVRDGVSGILVENDEEDWRVALMSLIDDPGLRARMAVEARERVVAEYSMAAALPRLVEALRSVTR